VTAGSSQRLAVAADLPWAYSAGLHVGMSACWMQTDDASNYQWQQQMMPALPAKYCCSQLCARCTLSCCATQGCPSGGDQHGSHWKQQAVHPEHTGQSRSSCCLSCLGSWMIHRSWRQQQRQQKGSSSSSDDVATVGTSKMATARGRQLRVCVYQSVAQDTTRTVVCWQHVHQW